jgi:hypothetical protein
MPRIYIKSNTNILQKFKKGYSIPVGASAIGKFKDNKSEEFPSLIDAKDNMLSPISDMLEFVQENLSDLGEPEKSKSKK